MKQGQIYGHELSGLTETGIKRSGYDTVGLAGYCNHNRVCRGRIVNIMLVSVTERIRR